MPNPKDWIAEAAKEAASTVCDAFGTTYAAVGFLGSEHWDDVQEIVDSAVRKHAPVAPSPSVPEAVSDARAAEMHRTILELRRVNKEMKSRGIEMEVLPLAAQDLFVLLRDRAARVAEAAAKDECLTALADNWQCRDAEMRDRWFAAIRSIFTVLGRDVPEGFDQIAPSRAGQMVGYETAVKLYGEWRWDHPHGALRSLTAQINADENHLRNAPLGPIQKKRLQSSIAEARKDLGLLRTYLRLRDKSAVANLELP